MDDSTLGLVIGLIIGIIATSGIIEANVDCVYRPVLDEVCNELTDFNSTYQEMEVGISMEFNCVEVIDEIEESKSRINIIRGEESG